MITIAYFSGANKELQDKTGYKHGEKIWNTQLNDVITTILKAKLNIMIIQNRNNVPPYKTYTIWIDDKHFKQR